jgi:hypothetical protein
MLSPGGVLLADITLVIALGKNLVAGSGSRWMSGQARVVIGVTGHIAIGIAGKSGEAYTQCKQEYGDFFHKESS